MDDHKKQLNDFVIKLQGKDYILFEGLLNLAHQEGLKKINTKLLQIPSAENGQIAVVQAEVETEKGFFTGIGDASPSSVSRGLVPHIIRMAETRAIARALRFAVNIGMTTVEELGDLEGEKAEKGQLGENIGSKKETKFERDEETDLILNFGKYANQSLSEVFLSDRKYVEWLSENARDPQLRNLAKKLVINSPTSSEGLN
ncbi:MAG TPA: hypothetical protein GXX38_01115 [Clostridia bacterium]|nr:hypothetical protein [Clostridia bacterium]